LGVIQGTLDIFHRTLGFIQGTLGVIQGTQSVIQGTLGVIQGTPGVIQSTLVIFQGTLGVIQGTLGVIQGTLGVIQGTQRVIERVIHSAIIGRHLLELSFCNTYAEYSERNLATTEQDCLSRSRSQCRSSAISTYNNISIAYDHQLITCR